LRGLLQLKKPAAVLFATDIAARGLDFPNVDWVLQLDCPDDTETYIHRVGRTARFSSEGKALLVLLPSEAKMVPLLESAKVPLKQISVNPKHATAATAKVRAEVAADTELKTLAQKAFKSYVKSVALQPNKDVFDVHALPLDAFAEVRSCVRVICWFV
jgi:ATP-dependent RNA helicase DDX10/DBP4